MKFAISEKGDRLGVSLFFPDSRVVDLDSALRLASSGTWTFSEVGRGIDHLEYKISDRGSFVAAVRFTHGLEPPTRVLFENRDPDTDRLFKASKRSVLAAVKAFLEECSGRGLVSRAQKDNAVAELDRHNKVEV